MYAGPGHGCQSNPLFRDVVGLTVKTARQIGGDDLEILRGWLDEINYRNLPTISSVSYAVDLRIHLGSYAVLFQC
jgi:hypothetical protein